MKPRPRSETAPSRPEDFSHLNSRFSAICESEILYHLDKVLRSPSRREIHNLRRALRTGQALQALMAAPVDASSMNYKKILRRTLRATRKLRNADVLRVFLKGEGIRLVDRFSRKCGAIRLCRKLRMIWTPGSREEFGRICHKMSQKLREELPERAIGLDRELDRVLKDLGIFYFLWSSGTEKDFSSVHKLRINLKLISGKEKVLLGMGGRGEVLDKIRKSELRKILRLLGKMSDLLMIEEIYPRLKGKGRERRRFLGRIRELKRKTDSKIFRILGSRVPEVSSSS